MILVHELRKRFISEGRQIVAVDGVSFQVASGEVYGLLGPNGAGKTTTLRMVLGLLRPDGGYAEVAGYRTSDVPEEVKARIGFVQAGAGLYQWLTVREMLLFFADIYGSTPAEARAALDRLATVLDLKDFLDQRCTTLSTGQRQRAVLARALIHDPPVVLLDEPTLGLDVVGSQVVFQYIEQLRKEGRAVILCTHRLDQAQRVCDRFGLLHKSRMIHEGTMDDLRQQTSCENLVDIFLQLLQTPAAVAPAAVAGAD